MLVITANLMFYNLFIYYTFNSELVYTSYIFYGTFVAYAHLCVYAPFRKMIKQKELVIQSTFTAVTFINVSYFLAFAIIVFGITTTSIQPLIIKYVISEGQTTYSAATNTLLHVIWSLVFVDIALFCLMNKGCSKEACHSLLVFNILTLVAVFVQIIIL
jgi:hypothetical protein